MYNTEKNLGFAEPFFILGCVLSLLTLVSSMKGVILTLQIVIYKFKDVRECVQSSKQQS